MSPALGKLQQDGRVHKSWLGKGNARFSYDRLLHIGLTKPEKHAIILILQGRGNNIAATERTSLEKEVLPCDME